MCFLIEYLNNIVFMNKQVEGIVKQLFIFLEKQTNFCY